MSDSPASIALRHQGVPPDEGVVDEVVVGGAMPPERFSCSLSSSADPLGRTPWVPVAVLLNGLLYGMNPRAILITSLL